MLTNNTHVDNLPISEKVVASVRKLLQTEFKGDMKAWKRDAFHEKLFYRGWVGFTGFFNGEPSLVNWSFVPRNHHTHSLHTEKVILAGNLGMKKYI